ncbi:MAG TPA: nucleotide exchange factor GrpE, partial [Nitrososphaeraceae archaeon]|nr:nucleotide exchange factor GrpE [Nitrososphaeraceae archaeon]
LSGIVHLNIINMINNDNSEKKEEEQTIDNNSESLKEELKEEEQTIDNNSESLKEELKKTKIQLEETKKNAETNLNKLKYMIADFDNYRKQIEKQMTSTIESNKSNLLSQFLTVHDDYQRAFDIIKKNQDLDEVFLNGLQGILKNLDSILQSEGVTPIETIGKILDPSKHDVISFSYNDDLPENTITNEIRIGYMLNDKVLRPSLVEISKKNIMNNNIDESN